MSLAICLLDTLRFFIISMIILAVETVYKIQSINGVSKCFLDPNLVSYIVSDFVFEALVLC